MGLIPDNWKRELEARQRDRKIARELIEALKDMVHLVEELDADAWDARVSCREALEHAREAIAKAEGRDE